MKDADIVIGKYYRIAGPGIHCYKIGSRVLITEFDTALNDQKETIKFWKAANKNYIGAIGPLPDMWQWVKAEDLEETTQIEEASLSKWQRFLQKIGVI